MSYIEKHYDEYKNKVYAGVLGKIIGVYMGRPVEGWTYDQIMDRLGEIRYYPNDKCETPLIVVDDDITGTFVFLRALDDYPEEGKNISSEHIGETWLNYVIENRTIFWWGGIGVSTEHTAYQRLLDNIKAPESGSSKLNGRVAAEQIGGQIFIDGWALVAPGDPETAVRMAGEAASVSHDGEGILGAQMIAAMESLAFIETDIRQLIESALAYIPQGSQIADIVRDMIKLHEREPDWKKAVSYLYENYPYSNYGGFCPIVPNHGLIILSLLYSRDDFQLSQMIVNTGGWDTDCNAANVGCIMGIKNGLSGIDKTVDFRGPVADRLYLPTAEGGHSISDALSVSQWIVNLGAKLNGRKAEEPPKGAKFNFEAPGAMQGFVLEKSPDHLKHVRIGNRDDMSPSGKHTLAIDFEGLCPGLKVEASTLTGFPLEHYGVNKTSYDLIASPTLICGQTVKTSVYMESSGNSSAVASIYIKINQSINNDNWKEPVALFETQTLSSNPTLLKAGNWTDLEFTVPDTKGSPVSSVGLQFFHPHEFDYPAGSGDLLGSMNGTFHIDYVHWSGVPKTYLWQEDWVNNAIDKTWTSTGDDCYQLPMYEKPILLSKTKGVGFMIQGNRSWRNYSISAELTPRLFKSGGLVLYYQGQKRHISLAFCEDGILRLLENIGNKKTIISEHNFLYELNQKYQMSIEIYENSVKGYINDILLLEGSFNHRQLSGGGCGLFVECGSLEMSSFYLNGSDLETEWH